MPPAWLNSFASNANGAVNALSNAKEAMREGIESVGMSVHNGLMWMANGFTLTQIAAAYAGERRGRFRKGRVRATTTAATNIASPAGTPRTIRLSNQPPPNGEIPSDIVRDEED